MERDLIRQYILATKMEDIPWNALTGPYGRAEAFPQWMKELLSAEKETAERAKNSLAMHMEHQDTLWHVTPFAMLCLRKTLSQAASEIPAKPETILAVLQILDLFLTVYRTIPDLREMDHAEPLPRFGDLLAPEHLLPDTDADEDNEDALLEDYYDGINESLFYSFFAYSWAVLALTMEEDFPRLAAWGDKNLSAALGAFDDKAVNDFLGSFDY